MDGQISQPPPQKLEYAPALPWYRRRTLSRRIIIAAVAVLLGVLTWQRGPAIMLRARLVYLQNRCMNFVAPPGTRLTSDKPFVAREWTQFKLAKSESPGKLEGTVFLGRMRSRSGNERLVVVEPGWFRGTSRADVSLHAEVYVPGTLWTNPRLAFVGERGAVFPVHASLHVARLDASGPDHIVIEAEGPGGNVIVDGWLRDNDDFIFEPRPRGISPEIPATSSPPR